MPVQRPSGNDASQSGRQEPMEQWERDLRQDRELRGLLRSFLGVQPEQPGQPGQPDKNQRNADDIIRSVGNVVANGLPTVGEVAPLTPAPAIAFQTTGMSGALLTPLDIANLARAEAARVLEEHEERLEEAPTNGGPYGPPFDEALLPIPDQFVGRDREFNLLLNQLEQGGAYGITSLRGMGGIGKTALAAKVARELRRKNAFPDGIAVVLCQGITDASEVLKNVLARFDPYRATLRVTSTHTINEAAQHLLIGKRALVVLDNVEPDLAIEQVVRPLRNAGISVLITARQALPSSVIPAVRSIEVGTLAPQQALEVFENTYGTGKEGRLSSDQENAAKRIVEALGAHTLATKLAGAYAAYANRDLQALASDLESSSALLSLSDGDKSDVIENLFRQSTNVLPQPAQKLLFMLPAFGDIIFGRKAVIALAQGLKIEQPEAALNLLILRSLLEASTNEALSPGSDRERLRIHLLLHAFSKKVFGEYSQSERDSAYQAVAQHYLGYINMLQDDAGSALISDEANVLASMIWAYENHQWAIVVSMCLRMARFWRSRAMTRKSQAYLPSGIEAAKELVRESNTSENRLHLANLQLELAQAFQRMGKLDEAENLMQSNLDMRRQEQDQAGEARVLFLLGKLSRDRSHLDDAQEYFTHSLKLHKDLTNRIGEGLDLGYLGRIAQARGSYNEAIEYFQQSLRIAQEQSDRQGEGRVLNSLGQVALAKGKTEEARDYFNHALAVFRERGDRSGEADAMTGLGRLAIDTGDLAEADSQLHQALVIDQEIMDRQGEGADLSLLAQVAVERGQLEIAVTLLERSKPIRHEVQDSRGQGVDYSLWGRIALAQGDLPKAREMYEHALNIARLVQNARGEGATLHQLGLVEIEEGNLEEATSYLEQSLAIAKKIQSEPDIARALLSLGKVMIHFNGNASGCNDIQEAIHIYQRTNRKADLENAQALARALGCGA